MYNVCCIKIFWCLKICSQKVFFYVGKYFACKAFFCKHVKKQFYQEKCFQMQKINKSCKQNVLRFDLKMFLEKQTIGGFVY